VTAAAAQSQGFFLPSAGGSLYAVYYNAGPSTEAVTDGPAVLFLPPFAEEMNKSRRMLMLTARACAVRGRAGLMVDLAGSGESSGDFSAARWEIWRENVADAVTWLQARGHREIAVVGLRMGALLALEQARAYPGSFSGILLWHPIVNGESMVTQFLRMRVAGGLMASADVRESTSQLRSLLTAGQSIEVGGYELSPHLIAALDGLRIEALADAAMPAIEWIEVVAGEGRGPTPAAKGIVETWRARGVNVSLSGVSGVPFWSTVEIATSPELIEHTLAKL
jgi:exosortase A-associated hydrolase 2